MASMLCVLMRSQSADGDGSAARWMTASRFWKAPSTSAAESKWTMVEGKSTGRRVKGVSSQSPFRPFIRTRPMVPLAPVIPTRCEGISHVPFDSVRGVLSVAPSVMNRWDVEFWRRTRSSECRVCREPRQRAHPPLPLTGSADSRFYARRIRPTAGNMEDIVGSMIRIYREVEERLAEAAGTAGQRLRTWRLPLFFSPASTAPRWSSARSSAPPRQ